MYWVQKGATLKKRAKSTQKVKITEKNANIRTKCINAEESINITRKTSILPKKNHISREKYL